MRTSKFERKRSSSSSRSNSNNSKNSSLKKSTIRNPDKKEGKNKEIPIENNSDSKKLQNQTLILPISSNQVTFTYVENLSPNVNLEHLKEIFSNFGVIKNVYINLKNSKNIRKSTLIEYLNKEDSDVAYKCMNGGQIDGIKIQVEIHKFNENELKIYLGNYKIRDVFTYQEIEKKKILDKQREEEKRINREKQRQIDDLKKKSENKKYSPKQDRNNKKTSNYKGKDLKEREDRYKRRKNPPSRSRSRSYSLKRKERYHSRRRHKEESSSSSSSSSSRSSSIYSSSNKSSSSQSSNSSSSSSSSNSHSSSKRSKNITKK